MALPIIETPRYELTLPSSDVQVQFRPFIVKEEKVLLIAMESKDTFIKHSKQFNTTYGDCHGPRVTFGFFDAGHLPNENNQFKVGRSYSDIVKQGCKHESVNTQSFPNK